MPRFLILLLALGAVLVVLWLWWAQPTENHDMSAYRQALSTLEGSTAAIDDGLQQFSSVFADLSVPDVGARMAELYADEVHFNDTLKTLTTGAEVAVYMGETGRRLDSSRVVVEQSLRDGADVFVRWRMEFRTSAFGIAIDSNSIGMTHLRFDDRGRVILHQDFWDAAAGLYEHLPLIGAVVRTAKKMMK